MPMVYPSGLDLAMYSVATLPNAPTLFSTITGFPTASCNFLAYKLT